MASNKELAEQALALGAKLSVEVKTDGLNNAALTELVAGLRAKLPPEGGDEAAKAKAEAALAAAKASEAEAAKVAAPPAEPTYHVAPGKGLTSLRGILGANVPVSARDFSGGQEKLDELVAKGHVVKS